MWGLSRTPSNSTNAKLVWLVSIILMLVSTTRSFVSAEEDADADPAADFGGYMEEMERRERDERLYEAKLNAHEEWRQTTWAGFGVRMVQKIGKHFGPFFLAIQNALDETSQDDGNTSIARIAAYLGIRMALVIGLLMAAYVGGKVLQLLIGSDYEIVEEVVIVHEHETEEEAAKARAGTTRGKKSKAKKA